MISKDIYITIGCQPGEPRPDAYFKNVIETLLNKYKWNDCQKSFLNQHLEKEPFSKLFGDWKWELSTNNLTTNDISDIKKKIGIILTEYYNNGLIRYAEW